jgi:hypothetical protein
MASVKIVTLLVRTAAKPISAQIKNQAKQHERFRGLCVDLAQFVHRTEIKLRTNILGEPAKHVRPLSETRAIETGANFIAESFLFSVAVALIMGETWRSSRNQTKRRDDVDDQLEDLGTRLQELTSRVGQLSESFEARMDEEKQRNQELSRILERVVEIGLRGGWTEFESTPLPIPRIELGRKPKNDADSLTLDTSGSSPSEDDSSSDNSQPPTAS